MNQFIGFRCFGTESSHPALPLTICPQSGDISPVYVLGNPQVTFTAAISSVLYFGVILSTPSGTG